ncbi:hypothetical protein TNCV_1531811 [Trichonephila clavipes]|nr:hypothetical protein TNCV_1531811 [Trichonephila clavipes]
MGKLPDLDAFDGGQILDARRIGHSVSEIHCLGFLVRVPASFNAIRYVELLGDPPPIIRTVMKLSSKTTVPLTSPGWLLTDLANIWQVIPMERFQKLVESMPRRVAAVIKASGGSIRY